MAEREERIILIRVDASAAVEGSRAATSALERMERGQAAAGASLDRLEKSLGRVGTYVKAQLAIQVAELGARLVQMAKQSLDAAAGLDELAEQLGTNARALQGMQFAAVSNGVKLEQLETGLSKFSQKMGEAAGGSKEMVEALNALGVKNLDVQGKLRPTEALLQEVAAAIVKIEDPAKRSAAAVDFFGKAGTRMLPLLGEMAKGSDSLADAAERAGAMIDAKTIKALDDMSDKAAQSSLKMRALFATIGAPIITASLDAVNRVLAEILGNLDALQKKAATAQTRALQGDVANLDEQIAAQRGLLAINPNNKMAQSSLNALIGRKGTAEAAVARSGVLDRQAGMMTDEERARGGTMPANLLNPDGPAGASTSAVKGAGQAEGDRIAKLERDTARELEAAGKLADASKNGARAVEQLEIHYKALKAAQDAYGNTADKNTGQVAALTAKIEAQMTAAEKLKAIKEFNLGTEELEKQNELLAAENRLINETVEVRSREISLIKLKHETQRSGLDASNQAERETIERREAAIMQNERLKAQAEELKRANELWTAPLKSALESIQRAGADAFEKMLESGKINFEELGQVFKKIVLRMAAEFLALATIRPVMSVIVNAVGGGSSGGGGIGGILGSLTGGGGGGGGAGGILQSLGGSVLQGSGGIGGLFKGAGSWLGGLFGAGGGAAASIPASALGGAAAGVGGGIGTAAGAGSGLLGGGIGGGLSAGFAAIPVAGWIAAAAAIAKGILGPGNGKSIGGVASTLLGPSPEEWMANPKRSAFDVLGPGGPVGAALLNAFGLHPFSDDIPPIVMNQEYGQLGYGSGPGGGFGTSGGAWGSNAQAGNMQNPLNAMGQTMQSIFDALGGVKDATKVWGVAMESLSRQQGEWQFWNRTSYLVDPSGGKRQWGQGSNAGDIGMESAGVAALLNSILEGATGKISANMRKALEGVNVSGTDTFDTLGKVVGEIMAFDEAMKKMTTTTAEDALKAIDESFKGMYETADKYKLDKGPLDTEKDKARAGVGKSFAESLTRQLMTPEQLAFIDIQNERVANYAENTALLAAKIPHYTDQALNIEAVYERKRLAIMEEANKSALAAQQAAVDAAKAKIQSLQDLIDRLTYGDLANASPTTAFSGTRATYMATLAQARAGSAEAADRLAGTAEAYANAGRSYFASSSEYAGIVEQIKRDLQERQGAIAAGASTNPQTTEQINALMRTISQQAQMFTDAQNENRQLREQMAALVAQLQRRA